MKDKSYIELLKKAKSGDSHAWTYLQNRFSRFALQIALKILKDEDLSQDIVQESFWELYQNLEKIRTLEAFPSLLKKALIKHGDRIRRKKEYQTLVFTDCQRIDPKGKEIHSTFFEKESSDTVLKNITMLEPEDQNLIELHYYRNFTLDEISKIQGQSLSSIKKRHLKLKSILRSQIGEGFRPEACFHLLAAA
ncbi:RNA polymerase sigma factor [Leptospira sp. WS92.C1]